MSVSSRTAGRIFGKRCPASRSETEPRESVPGLDVQVVVPELHRGDPLGRFELRIQADHARQRAALENEEDHVEGAPGAVGEPLLRAPLLEEERSGLSDLEAELLAHLSPKPFLERLPGLEAAARQTPLPGKDPAIRRHPTEEIVAAGIPEKRHDDDPVGRRSGSGRRRYFPPSRTRYELSAAIRTAPRQHSRTRVTERALIAADPGGRRGRQVRAAPLAARFHRETAQTYSLEITGRSESRARNADGVRPNARRKKSVKWLWLA